jgi:hypothetical protein
MANGGWIAGKVAESLGSDPIEVTLRGPTPLDTPLRIEYDGQVARLVSDGAVLVEARAARELPEPPPYVPMEEAIRAGNRLTRRVGRSRRSTTPRPGCGTTRKGAKPRVPIADVRRRSASRRCHQ